MYKTKLILTLIISSISCAAFAADDAVGGLPLGGLPKGAEPKTTDVNGVPLVENNAPQKLKSVKDLFKPSKTPAPAEPNISAEKPEILGVESEDTKPQEQPSNPASAPFAAETPAAPAVAPNSPTPATELPSENLLRATSKDNDDEQNLDTSAEGTSIMFDQTNIYRVMRVLSAYIESQSNKVDSAVQEQSKKSLEELQQELLAKLNPENFVKAKKDIVTVRLPAYVRVDSIIFRSASNKKAWVNSRQLIEGDNNGELTIKAIQPEWVYIELSTKDTNIGLDKFERLLKKSKNPNGIKIDIEKQTISFRLSVNQYIELSSLKIKEGKYTGSFGNKFYDPTKPEDRFVPLDEAEKNAEAQTIENLSPDATSTTDEKLEEIKPVDEIDAGEESNDEIMAPKAEKTIIETSPKKL